MAKTKKTGSFVEKAEKAVEAVVEEVAENVEKSAKKIVKAVEKIVESVDSEKETKKKKTDSEDKKAKLAKLMEKAKKLEEGVVEKSSDMKKKLENEEEEKKDTLVSMDDYLKSSIHLGTRVITPDMRKYVYRRRADGLAVFNTALLDDKIREAVDYLAKFAPKDIILACKREAGWKAAAIFSEVTGIRSFLKKYPAGILTNTNLENFIETELVLIADPWLDKNALEDANRVGVPVMSLCDTNNFTKGINQILPGNNKSPKSLGMIFYLLTKLYVEKRGLKVEVPPIQKFVDGWDELQPPK